MEKLRESITDDYERSGGKANREYPRKNRKKPIGEPKITKASREQRKIAKELTSAL